MLFSTAMANKSLRSNTRIQLCRKRKGDDSYDVRATEIHRMKTRSKLGPNMEIEEIYYSPSPKKLKQMKIDKDDTLKFPIFTSPTKSPVHPKIPPSRRASLSPSSPSKRQVALLKQGSNQSNKIFKYLKPNRPLEESTNAVKLNSALEPINLQDSQSNDLTTSNDKENNPVTLKVEIVVPASTDHVETSDDHQCCRTENPIVESECEHVVQALDIIINAHVGNPAQRLGVQTYQSLHDKVNAAQCTIQQENLYLTMANSNLQAMMLRQCLKVLTPQCYLSPVLVHTIFSIIKNTADRRLHMLGESCLQQLIRLHPPRILEMRKFYLSILHCPHYEMKSENQLWSLMECKLFEELLLEIEKQVEGMLSPEQLKKKREIAVQRNIVKPKRFIDSPSPHKKRRRSSAAPAPTEACHVPYEEADFDTRMEDDIENMCLQARERRLHAEAALNALSDEERIENMFARLNPLVEILEQDLIAWLSNHRNQLFKICDRTICPLIVMAVWKPGSDTGFDSINCRRVFSLYASLWILRLHPKHLKTLSRLIGLIAEVVNASEPNPMNVYPNHGIRAEIMSRKVADVLKAEHLAENKYAAVAMLKPAWFRMFVTSSLLGIKPSIESVHPETWPSPITNCLPLLYSAFLEAALDTYHVKEALYLLNSASQENKIEKQPGECVSGCPQVVIDYKVIFHQIMAFHSLQKVFKEEINSYKTQREAIQHLL